MTFVRGRQMFILLGAITGCAETRSTGPVAGAAAPGGFRDESGLMQQTCPSDSALVGAMKTACEEAVLAQFAQSVIHFGHQQWHPADVGRSNDLYSNFYAGKAFLTVLRVRVDGIGIINDIGIDNSSGSERLDRDALAAFKRGRIMPSPPDCALSDGEFQFRLGVCVQVTRAGQIGWRDADDQTAPVKAAPRSERAGAPHGTVGVPAAPPAAPPPGELLLRDGVQDPAPTP